MRPTNLCIAFLFALAACQQGAPTIQRTEAVDHDRMIHSQTVDHMEISYITFAKLAKALLDNRRVADREGLRALDREAYAHVKAAREAADNNDFDGFVRENAAAREKFRAILKIAGVKKHVRGT